VPFSRERVHLYECLIWSLSRRGNVPEAEWLDEGETLTYLRNCISTRRQRVRVPGIPMYLDAILADEDLTGGLEPRLGGAHLRTLTIMGFPSQTWPGLLDGLNRLAFPYRWVTRAICLDKTDPVTNAHGSDPPGENFAVNRVTIPNDILGRPFPAEGLCKLPAHPFGRWMGRHSQPQDLAPAVL